MTRLFHPHGNWIDRFGRRFDVIFEEDEDAAALFYRAACRPKVFGVFNTLRRNDDRLTIGHHRRPAFQTRAT